MLLITPPILLLHWCITRLLNQTNDISYSSGDFNTSMCRTWMMNDVGCSAVLSPGEICQVMRTISRHPNMTHHIWNQHLLYLEFWNIFDPLSPIRSGDVERLANYLWQCSVLSLSMSQVTKKVNIGWTVWVVIFHIWEKSVENWLNFLSM